MICDFCGGGRVFVKDNAPTEGKKVIRYTCPDCLGELNHDVECAPTVCVPGCPQLKVMSP